VLKHCVFMNYKAEVNAIERKDVMENLAKLMGQVDGLLAFEYGDNLDFENKSGIYQDGFIVTFKDRQSHLAYEAHPEHIKAGGRLVDMCVGGHNGIIVFDLDVGGK